MRDILIRFIFLILTYGVIGIIAGKSASGDVVRFICTIGMLVFITGTIDDIKTIDVLYDWDIGIIKQSAKDGEKMLMDETNGYVAGFIEKDIEDICRNYGEKGNVQVFLEIENGKAEIEKIVVENINEHSKSIVLIEEEIQSKYNVRQVEISGD